MMASILPEETEEGGASSELVQVDTVASGAEAPAFSVPVEETEEAGDGLPSAPQSLKQKMDFLKGGRRALSADEVASPIASRFLIEEIERLDEEVKTLRQYRDMYHERDKECALQQRDGEHKQSMNLRDATVLAIGSAGIGAAPSYIQISWLGWVFFILSAVLVAASFMSKK